MTIDTLDALLEEELKDLYDAEKQLTKALPKMAKAATDKELKDGFTQHLEQTKEHVSRLEQVFQAIGKKAKSKPCEAMKGLVEEGSETIDEDASDDMKDAMLIGSSQRIEHYEIAAYGTCRTIAETIGNQDVVDLLQQTLDEEKQTDEKLTEISKRILGAAKNGDEEEDEDVNEDDDEEIDEDDPDLGEESDDEESDDEDDELEEEDDEDEEEEEEKKPTPAPAKKKAPAPAKKKR